jgi:hypothetical protein
MVNNRNVTRTEPFGQVFGARVNANDPPDAWQIGLVGGSLAQAQGAQEKGHLAHCPMG